MNDLQTGLEHNRKVYRAQKKRIAELEAQLAWIKENHPQIYLMATQKQGNEDE